MGWSKFIISGIIVMDQGYNVTDVWCRMTVNSADDSKQRVMMVFITFSHLRVELKSLTVSLISILSVTTDYWLMYI